MRRIAQRRLGLKRHEFAPRSRSPASSDSRKALALHRQGKHELAMQRYVAILQQNPGNVDALYYVAMIAIQQQQFADGLKVIARGLELSPSDARLHNLKGRCICGKNADDEALNSFSRAIEADPAFADAYGNRGTLLSEMGRRRRPWPTSTERWSCGRQSRRPLQPGERAGGSGPSGCGAAGFHPGACAMPDMAPAYFNRAGVLMRLGQPAEALRDCDRAIGLYPEMAAAHQPARDSVAGAGRPDDAEVSFSAPRSSIRSSKIGRPSLAQRPKHTRRRLHLCEPIGAARLDHLRRVPRTVCSSPRRHAPRPMPVVDCETALLPTPAPATPSRSAW